MREIKFRIPIYSHSIGAFLRFDIITLRQGTVSCTCPAVISNDEVHKDEEQFTGFRDKNGEEIYEGDILKCGDYVLVCEWDNERAEFRFRVSTKVATGFHSSYVKQMEIISNIHENPELMKNARA